MNHPAFPLLHLCTTGVVPHVAARSLALIHAGHLDGSDLAVQALAIQGHLQRIAPHARLIVIAAGRRPLPHRHDAGAVTPRFVSRPRAGILCAAHLARRCLLVPARHETFGDIFLQALASGVPLDTVNYYLPEPPEFDHALRTGDVLIRIRARIGAGLRHGRPGAMHRRPAQPGTGMATTIIQDTPKRSVTTPKLDAKNVAASGC